LKFVNQQFAGADLQPRAGFYFRLSLQRIVIASVSPDERGTKILRSEKKPLTYSTFPSTADEVATEALSHPPRFTLTAFFLNFHFNISCCDSPAESLAIPPQQAVKSRLFLRDAAISHAITTKASPAHRPTFNPL
jgi:hypothetical protein